MAEPMQAHALSALAALEPQLALDALPRHVAVIMDGNGRWGVSHGGTREYGHRESVDAMRAVVTAASDLGLGYLSLYCFSTENLGRPAEEVSSLFQLFNDVLDSEPRRLHEKNVRIITSGLVELLPEPLPEKFAQALALTAGNSGLTLNLCVMYSGRSELIDAARRMAAAVAGGAFKLERLNERTLRQFFYHPEIPDVDLVVRTSGEQRLSNFLLWQMAYSELVFTDVLWPDFSRADFCAALLEYQNRNRRFGKV
jgi:undecaprenyl diphosphate synthase